MLFVHTLADMLVDREMCSQHLDNRLLKKTAVGNKNHITDFIQVLCLWV